MSTATNDSESMLLRVIVEMKMETGGMVGGLKLARVLPSLLKETAMMHQLFFFFMLSPGRSNFCAST